MSDGTIHTERDPKTGEMILRWSYYDPVSDQDVPFEKRFHPNDYVTDAQLSTEYRLMQAQRNALGGYDIRTSRTERWGYKVPTLWWRRELVEAVVTSQPGYQPALFS
jgi:hypothetical protein